MAKEALPQPMVDSSVMLGGHLWSSMVITGCADRGPGREGDMWQRVARVASGAEEAADHDRQVVFGRLLRAHRQAALLTQEELAKRAGITARTIRELERGRVHQPRGDSVRLLADALGLAGATRLEFQVAARGAGGPHALAAGESAIPCQLPYDIADFTGRTELVTRLSDLLAGTPDGAPPPAATVVAAIVGGGGMGKTTLAVHVAHRVRTRFPDGQLYVDLRGAEASPTAPKDVLGRFLHSMGVNGTAVPGGSDERAALYRSLLADRQMLVLLDNAASEAQVIPLLPGSPTCGVLVTSRAALTGLGGVRRLELDVLQAEQAVELLGRIVGSGRVTAEPAAAAELARLCGYLPLALRVAAARLAARPHWRLDQLVARLADERWRLEELAHGHLAVRASLALSYQALEPAARLLFGRLGLLQAPDVAAWVAAALLDTSVEQAAELADRLVDARLLEVAGWDATGQVRYRFHDLVRVYARECAKAEDPPTAPSAALARAFGAWLHLAERADARLGNPLLEPVYGSAVRWPVDQAATGRLLADPLAYLEAERAGLVAAVTQAARLGMAGLSWELTSALTQFLATRMHLDDWHRCTAEALAAARHAGDACGEAAVLLSLGSLQTIRPGGGRHREALDCWRAALGRFERLGHAPGRAMCLAALAVYDSDRRAFQRRRRQLEEALAILDPGGSARARACVLQCLGDHSHNHGRFELARRCFQEALELHRRLGSRRGEARLLYQLGAVRIKQGCDQQAVDLLRQALAILRPAGDLLSGTPAEVCLGTALVHLGHYTQARPLLEPRADSGFPFIRGWALRALGELDHAQGRHDQARAALCEALRLFCELDMPAEEVATLRALDALGDDGPTHDHAAPRTAHTAPSATA
jgi:tetratricopeptide (TPR) repeat protein/transcriptional regulator with XRE-family HTH domain